MVATPWRLPCTPAPPPIVNESTGSITAIAEGSNAVGIDIFDSDVYNAGTLKTDSMKVRTYGGISSRPISTLVLLDGSTTGAHTEGGTLAVKTDYDSVIQLGGALAADGNLTSTANGSQVTISSNLALTGGILRLVDNATVTIDGELSLTKVTVSGLGSLRTASGEALTLNADGATFVLDAYNSAQASPLLALLSTGDPLTETQVAPSVLYINTPLLEGVNVNGNITLDLSNWEDVVEAGGYESIALNLGNTTSFTAGSSITAKVGEESYTGTASANGAVQFSMVSSPAVPEPATTTLSLLALAALAGRRRRG